LRSITGLAMNRAESIDGAGIAAAASSGDWNAVWKVLGASGATAPVAS
jgi:hypothetical protein